MKIKQKVGGHHFARDDDVVNTVEQNDVFYRERIRLLHDLWTKCVNVGGEYVETLLHMIFKTDSFYLRSRTYATFPITSYIASFYWS